MTKRTQFGPVAHEVGALRTPDLNRVTVDTTVQPKAITFATDAKLLHAAIKGLNRLARKYGGRLRQSYLRNAKRAAMMASRYGHAKQFRRHHRQLRLPRSRLGRMTLDIRRKIAGRPELAAVFRSAARACRADPIAAAAPARMEALFPPRPRGRMHRQGQGRGSLRVRRQSLDRHHQRLRPRWPVHAPRQDAPGNPL